MTALVHLVFLLHGSCGPRGGISPRSLQYCSGHDCGHDLSSFGQNLSDPG